MMKNIFIQKEKKVILIVLKSESFKKNKNRDPINTLYLIILILFHQFIFSLYDKSYNFNIVPHHPYSLSNNFNYISSIYIFF